jgi:hypothetical protein
MLRAVDVSADGLGKRLYELLLLGSLLRKDEFLLLFLVHAVRSLRLRPQDAE